MKTVKDYYDHFDDCREREIPMCADACPFKIDILDIQERLSKKRYSAAYKTLRDKVAFPGIVAEICPGYCEQSCIRRSIDEPISINLLEKTLIAKTTKKEPNAYNLPAKKERIAIIGAGLAGMGFAAKMASRKYDVTIFEKTDRIGGSLVELMDESSFMAEFELQLKNEKYNVQLNSEITDLDELSQEYDVIFIATGKGGNDFGIPSSDGCAIIGKAGVFLGGSIMGLDPVNALAQAIALSTSAENYIKVKKLEYPAPAVATRCVANEDKLTLASAVKPTEEIDGRLVYSDEECQAEVSRCIKCQCDACDSYCDIVGFYEKWPLKMRDEIFLSVKPAGSLVHKCPSRKYIAACTDCDIMRDVCPSGIDLCGMIKSARHQMHNADKMPAGFTQYYIRDMEFANSHFAALTKLAPGSQGSSCSYAFFPGCNMGALDPEYVLKPYKWLLENMPGTGLILRCCGIPCDWSGNTQMHDQEIAALKAEWESLGKPILITACMSCHKHLSENLPEIETRSLYEIMSQIGITTPGQQECKVYSIFDPCSARGNVSVQDAVRDLASKVGLSIEELPKSDKHGCCGFGGQGDIAAGDFSKYVTEKRASLSDNPYLVYCSNCRDVFNDYGKEAVHILDAVFAINTDNSAPSPGLSLRRENRVELKERLLTEIWGESMNDKPAALPYELKMSPETADKIKHQKILNEDICAVIAHAEETGRRTYSPDTQHYKAYKEIGSVTLWVEYTEEAENIRYIHNMYSHRMQIQLEAVFNGKKIDG